MLFNSFAYMVFLPIVVLLYWACPRKWRTLLLLVSSYIFYMFWKPIYGLLILALTVANYFLGLHLDKTKEHRKLFLICGIAFNILVLGFFKYAYFARDSANSVLGLLGAHQLPQFSFEIILPLGISFFAFEFIHYIADVYKGSPAVKSFTEFALFPSFFPTQIAGPIKRFQDFVPQLKHDTKFKIEYFNEGVELILFGLFKKVCLADNVAIVVNRCYAHPDLLTASDMWLATWAFFFQVYFDFSGYTDVARGSALLMGFKVPINFDMPMLAGSIADYWRRWHMSLSTWLRDYLFIPLGGSKHGEFNTQRNTLITMTVCGLWHGANLNFLVWGFYLGLMSVIHREWQKFSRRHKVLQDIVATKLFHIFAVAFTFNCFSFGLVFFRSQDMKMAFSVMRKMLLLDPGPLGTTAWIPSMLNTSGNVMFLLLPFMLAGFVIAQIIVSKFKETPGIMPTPRFFPGLKAVYLAALAIILLLVAPGVTANYIYFQF
jgi:D-alanyl-lipoteichoic acid acyltransferase DltB (MBOAT superfamily)